MVPSRTSGRRDSPSAAGIRHLPESLTPGVAAFVGAATSNAPLVTCPVIGATQTVRSRSKPSTVRHHREAIGVSKMLYFNSTRA